VFIDPWHRSRSGAAPGLPRRDDSCAKRGRCSGIRAAASCLCTLRQIARKGRNAGLGAQIHRTAQATLAGGKTGDAEGGYPVHRCAGARKGYSGLGAVVDQGSDSGILRVDHDAGAALVRSYLAVAARGELQRAETYFAADFAYQVPLDTPLAASKRSRKEALEYFGNLVAASQGNCRIDTQVDQPHGERLVLLVADESMMIDGQEHAWSRHILFHIRNGRFSEVQLFEEDHPEARSSPCRASTAQTG
jgi:ketosteroid isomerase-like protein